MKTKKLLQAAAVKLSLLILIFIGNPGATAQAPSLLLLIGEVVRPANLQERDRVSVGTVIQTTEDALVILTYSWPSDEELFPCIGWVIISGRQTHRVKDVATPNRCDRNIIGNEVERANRGEVFVSTLRFYGDPPYDVPVQPKKVRRSQEQARRLQIQFQELKKTKVPAIPPTRVIPPARVIPATINITGRWKCNDGGIYFMRQVGRELWWYGQSSDSGRSWTNVFHGQIQGNRITGKWADVPKGRAQSSGKMTLKILGRNRLRAIERTGGFGGSEWTR